MRCWVEVPSLREACLCSKVKVRLPKSRGYAELLHGGCPLVQDRLDLTRLLAKHSSVVGVEGRECNQRGKAKVEAEGISNRFPLKTAKIRVDRKGATSIRHMVYGGRIVLSKRSDEW